EWVDKAILERGDITVGAKGIRAIGRLAYFLNFNNIKKAFNTVLSKVTDQPNLRYMVENHGIQVATGVNVFLLTSICGGTGSGMFLDLAFTIKALLSGTEHQRIGYLVMPGVFGTDMAKGAGYAAMRELNHYQMDHEFEANWENENQPTILPPPPFDFCYMVNNSNGKISFHQKEHLFEMIAHNIFLEFAHEFGQYKASLKDNVQASSIGTDKLGCPLNYISIGLSTISFPRERIIRSCSYKLAGEIVEKWMTGEKDTDRIEDYLDHFLDYNKLYIDTDNVRKNQIKDELLKIRGGGNYYSKIDDEMTSVFNGIKKQKTKFYDNFIERREEELEKKFYEGDAEPERWGEYFRGIYRNRLQKKEEVQELLNKTISKMIQSEREGIEYAKEFLIALEQRFIHYGDYSRSKFNLISKGESSFAKKKVQDLEKLKSYEKTFVFDRKKVMIDQVDKLTNSKDGTLNNYFKKKLDKKILEMMITLTSEIAEYAAYLIKEIDLFKEKLAKVQRALKDTQDSIILDASASDVYSLVLYEKGDVDRYYQEYVRSKDQAMERDTAMLVGEKSLATLNAGDIFELRKEEYGIQEIKDALVRECMPTFEPIKNITVARKFFEKYPTESEQRMHLRNVFTSSEVFLNFRHVPDFTKMPNSKVSLIGVFEGRQPTAKDFVKLLPLLERSCSEPDQLRGIQPIRHKDEIIFTTEEGAFPLRMINEIDDYESKYDKLSQGYQNPLHLRKYDKDFLVEIIRPTEAEQQKARIGTYIGFALGLLKADPDDPESVIYSYRDPRTGFIENKPMGRVGEEERIIDNLLHRFNKDLRQIIFQEVDNKLKGVARNREQKKKIWQAISDYREAYMKTRDRDWLERYQIPDFFKNIIQGYNLFDPSFLEETV
ncbi:MAG: tubulin-like doman-containing protein, partial [Vulcanimicrobiota bacterium]